MVSTTKVHMVIDIAMATEVMATAMATAMVMDMAIMMKNIHLITTRNVDSNFNLSS